MKKIKAKNIKKGDIVRGETVSGGNFFGKVLLRRVISSSSIEIKKYIYYLDIDGNLNSTTEIRTGSRYFKDSKVVEILTEEELDLMFLQL